MSKGSSCSEQQQQQQRIPSREFYGEYHGHKVRHLRTVLSRLRGRSDRIIWTAGDSSLDNKYWFHERATAVGAYADVLEPPRSTQDVTYWLNYLCQNSNNGGNVAVGGSSSGVAGSSSENEKARSLLRSRTAAINTAVEATTLNERTFRLRPQDVFLRDNVGPEDVLIVSVGGNDIALAPCPCTVASIGSLICCMPTACIDNGYSYGVIPVDDCCCGCGASLGSCACACPPCLGYFRHLFGTRIQLYIEALTKRTRPSKVLVCMIYYPDESNTPSWAGPALGALGYNTNPAKLQALIRKAFSDAVSSIRVQGTQVVPVPLFRVLDGKNSEDYIARVEPSAIGGRKMAEFLLDVIDQHPTATCSSASAAGSPLVTFAGGGTTAPVKSYMSERT